MLTDAETRAIERKHTWEDLAAEVLEYEADMALRVRVLNFLALARQCLSLPVPVSMCSGGRIELYWDDTEKDIYFDFSFFDDDNLCSLYGRCRKSDREIFSEGIDQLVIDLAWIEQNINKNLTLLGEAEMEKVAKPNMATRLTPDDIEAMIINETYDVLPSGLVMICELTLYNGLSVIGKSTVIDRNNYLEDKGRTASRADAFNNAWAVGGILMQERLYWASRGIVLNSPNLMKVKEPDWTLPPSTPPIAERKVFEAAADAHIAQAKLQAETNAEGAQEPITEEQRVKDYERSVGRSDRPRPDPINVTVK